MRCSQRVGYAALWLAYAAACRRCAHPALISLPRPRDPRGCPGIATSCWSCIYADSCFGSCAPRSISAKPAASRLVAAPQGRLRTGGVHVITLFPREAPQPLRTCFRPIPVPECMLCAQPEAFAYHRGVALLLCSATGSFRSCLGQHVLTLTGRNSDLHNLFFYSLDSVPRDAAV